MVKLDLRGMGMPNFDLTDFREHSQSVTFTRKFETIGENGIDKRNYSETITLDKDTWLQLGRPLELMITGLCCGDRE